MTRVSTHTLLGVVPSNYEGLKSLLGPCGVLKDAGSHERPLGRAAADLGLQSLIIISSSTSHTRRHRRHTLVVIAATPTPSACLRNPIHVPIVRQHVQFPRAILPDRQHLAEPRHVPQG